MTAFGFLLPTREIVMAQATPNFAQILDLAEQAEALGFGSLWVGDSVLARPRFEALTTLAAVAARTQHVQLGTAVLLPMLRHPVVLANEVASLDLIANGRLILGVGIGGNNPTVAHEFAACGVSLARRVGLFEETISLMRRLWTEPEVTFQGRYFQIQSARLGLRPLQKSGVRLFLAGSADNALRRVLRLADGWLPISSSPQAFTADWERLQLLGQEIGRDAHDLHRCLYTTLNVNADIVQAERELRTFIESYYGVSYEEQARRNGLCAGSAEHCIAWLKAFSAAGAQTIVVRFGSPDQSGQLVRFARDVLPHVH
jgi:alkanesulfonate monooxygenase SsuD/methylene tetrahydromethanopterin reductase-like flavin-dependent oxidoreductase (luciferase family)